jgi:hypothetical protein
MRSGPVALGAQFRDADVSATLNICAQAVSVRKREAATKAVKKLLGGENTEGAFPPPKWYLKVFRYNS